MPVRISIPAIRLASQLVRLDLDADGGLQALKDFDRPGWYAGGPVPGEPGTALIVGHVDSYEGPAVFQRLEQLERGDRIAVQLADGSLVRFVVDRLASYPKSRFPTDEVFAWSAPQLRLITCFGSFDKARKSYTRNLVVYASLAAPVSLPAQSRPRTAPHQKELL
jgi:sortase (surface protein transpeptidase)